jgi:hypothetical protein
MLATCVTSKRKEVEMLYSGCATSGSLYVFSDSLIRCAECVRRDVRCDSNFSIDDFDHLTAE